MVINILLRSTRSLTLAQESEKESIRQMEESAVVERVEIDENGGKFLVCAWLKLLHFAVARIVGSGAKDTGYENRPTGEPS